MRAYRDTPIKIDTEVNLRIRRGDFEVSAVLLQEDGAPQDLLIGTDIQDALGIKLCLEEGHQLEPISCGDRRSLVKLLKAHQNPSPTCWDSPSCGK